MKPPTKRISPAPAPNANVAQPPQQTRKVPIAQRFKNQAAIAQTAFQKPATTTRPRNTLMGLPVFEIKDSVTVRLLPCVDPDRAFFAQVKLHFLDVGDYRARVICKNTMGPETCFCAAMRDLYLEAKEQANGNEATYRRLVDDLKRQYPESVSKVQSYALAVKDGVVGVLPLPASTLKPLEKAFTAKRGGDYLHPLTGFPITITKSGAGFDTEYAVDFDKGEACPLFDCDDDALEAFFDSLPNVHTLASLSFQQTREGTYYSNRMLGTLRDHGIDEARKECEEYPPAEIALPQHNSKPASMEEDDELPF